MYGSREVSLGKGKEQGKRCFLPLVLCPISQKHYLLPGALLIFTSLPLLPVRSCSAERPEAGETSSAAK